jgi:hypothetical protein
METMVNDGDRSTTRVFELQNGDETVDFGVVVHREGRKVWFEDRIVTFSSDDEEVALVRSSLRH